MAGAALAPSNNEQTLNEPGSSNPFATPVLDPIDLPAAPKPVAYPSTSPRQPPFEGHIRPTTLYGGSENEKVAYPYKSESMSSTGGCSGMTPISSIDLEKAGRRNSSSRQHRSASRERRSRERSNVDPEKAAHHSPYGSRDRALASHRQRVAYLEDDETEDARQLQEEKAVNILFFLSGPCVILSFLNAIWTLISLLIVTLAQPVRICARRPTFGQQLGGLLGPALNLQLKSIYTPLPPYADEDTSYNPGMLLTVQLLSPFLGLGMMLAAWVAAIFWLSSVVVGDPSGTDKRDDGRETVLSLRNWWEKWLERSVRED